MELLERLEVTERTVAEGVAVREADIDSKADPLATLRIDSAPTPYPYVLVLPQSRTEGLLAERAGELGVDHYRRPRGTYPTPSSMIVKVMPIGSM